MDSNRDKPTHSRRDFLKVAGMTTAGVLASNLAKSSAYAIAPPRAIGANDRILIGHIGCGGQGQAHIRIMKENAQANNSQQVAVCDIYTRRKNEAKGQAGVSDSAVYHEYRKVLELKPDLFEARLNLGQTLLKTGKPEEAVDLLEKAAAQKPAAREVEA